MTILAKHVIKQNLKIDPTAFIAPGARLIGDIEIKEDASIWYNVVLRADIAPIRIGKESNVQDNATVHVDYDMPAIIEDNVTIGHNAVVHGAEIGHHSLIAMNATVLSGAKIGHHSIVAAGAVVPEKMEVPPYSMVVGIPGKIKKTLAEEDLKSVKAGNLDYIELGKAAKLLEEEGQKKKS